MVQGSCRRGCGGGPWGVGRGLVLSDQTSDSVIQAVDHLRVLLIDTVTLQATMEQSPRLAQDLGEQMELRRRAIETTRLQTSTPQSNH